MSILHISHFCNVIFCTNIELMIFERGGNSFASYENVVTTAKIISTSDKTSAKGGLGLTLKSGTTVETESCTGAGGGLAGPVAIICKVSAYAFKETLGFIITHSYIRSNVEQDAVSNKNTLEYPLKVDLNTDFRNKDYSKSTTFSTTWSYTTSASPKR